MRFLFKNFSVCFSKAISSFLSFIWLLAFTNALAFDELPEGQWSYQVGLDTWEINTSVAKDIGPANAQNSNLLLPNATKWPYKSPSAFVNAMGRQQVDQNTYLSFKARADQNVGMRIDEAMVEHNISPALGLRLGVVNYKTSWCRNYEPDKGWIREVETICITNGLQDVTGGGPGLQIFTHETWGNYSVQSQVGLYRPLALHFQPREFGNFYPSTNFQVTKNNKVGFNVNVLNLDTAIEGRLSYIHAIQRAYIHEDISTAIPQQSGMWYLGLSAPITQTLTARMTQLLQMQRIECLSAQSSDLCNYKIHLQKSATAIELAYKATSVDLLSLGLSQSNINMYLDVYKPLPDATFIFHDDVYLETHQLSTAWRHDWGGGLYSIIQAIKAEQKNGFMAKNFASHGDALGIRLGYVY